MSPTPRDAPELRHVELREACLALVTGEPGATLDRAVERISGPATDAGLPSRAALDAALESLVADGLLERVAGGGFRRVPEPDLATVVRDAVREHAAEQAAAEQQSTGGTP
jgi:hypothetical protein